MEEGEAMMLFLIVNFGGTIALSLILAEKVVLSEVNARMASSSHL